MQAPASPYHAEPQPAKSGNTTTSEEVYPVDLIRRAMQKWVDALEMSPSDLIPRPFDAIPPVCIVMCPDLLGEIWGWERLLPDVHSSVEWHYYKAYLLKYLEKNAAKNLSGEDALHDAVNRCIEAERRLFRVCHSFLSCEEIGLSTDIKNQARDLLQSDGEYPAATATLLALAREADLMCEMKIKGYITSIVCALAHRIREAAFKLILFRGSESAAVTAAMLGLEDASKLLVDELRGGGSAITVFFKNVKLREGFAKVLTKLGEEVARETAGNAGTLTSATNELIRVEKGDKKMSKSSHSVVVGRGYTIFV